MFTSGDLEEHHMYYVNANYLTLGSIILKLTYILYNL